MPALNPLKIRGRTFHLPGDLCSHLQNVSRAALARTVIPYSQTSLAISSILLRHGLISNVTLGGPLSPDPAGFSNLPAPQQRIWLGLKYRNGLPVLRNISLISKPSKRTYVSHMQLGRILTGRRAQNVPGVGVGEVLLLKTEPNVDMGRTGKDTVMEGWEAWRAGLGGELIVRFS